MKKILYILLAVATLTACNHDNDNKAKGQLSVTAYNNYIIVQTNTAAGTKAEQELAPAGDNYKVTITETLSGTQAYSASYGELKLSPLTIEQGIYRIFAENIPETDAAWEAPRYAGYQDVTVTAGYKTDANIVCMFSNVKVTITYTDLFNSTFNLEKTTVSRGAGQLEFMPNEIRAGYFTPGTLYVTVQGTRKADNTPFSFDYVMEDVGVATWNKITIDLKQFANPDMGIELTNDLTAPEDHVTELNPFQTQRH